MTEPQPVRITEAVRITRAAEVVETVRVIEYASAPPAVRQELESGVAAPRGYDPERDSPLARTGMELDGWAPARRALPPGSPAPARGWRPRWWPW